MNSDEVEVCVLAGRIAELLEAASGTTTIRRRRFLLDGCERALRLADPGTVSEAMRLVAVGLGLEVPRETAPPPNTVRVPFDVGGTDGFVRGLFVTFRPHEHAVIDPRLHAHEGSHRAVERALAAAAGREGRSAEGHLLTALRPEVFRDVRLEGSSLAAAAFVSVMSAWTRRPVRPEVVVTGGIQGERVRSVGKLASKYEALLRARSSARTTDVLVVPAVDRDSLPKRGAVQVVGVDDLDALLGATLAPTPTAAPRHDDLVLEAMRAFRGGWRGWRWQSVRAQLEALAADLPSRRVDLQVLVLALLGGALRNLGDPDASLLVLDRAIAVSETEDGREGVPDVPLAWLWRTRAATLRQLGAFTEAWKAAREAVHIARRGRLREHLIWSHGTAGLVAMSRRDNERAIEHHRKAMETALRHTPASAPRSGAYLVEALGADGRLDQARQTFELALDQIRRHVGGDSAASKTTWLRVALASAAVRNGDTEGALRALDDDDVERALSTEPQPGLQVRRHLGRALVSAGRAAEGYALLGASPSAYGRMLVGHTAFLAQQNVLLEVRLRAERGDLDDDARARGRRALDRLPPYEAAARLLQPRAADAMASLDEACPARAVEALDSLLDVCERLG